MTAPFPVMKPWAGSIEPVVLNYRLEMFTKRLVFDVIWQEAELTWKGDDDGDYYHFRASNGYEVISRSRMDIQTERLWLLGAKCDDPEGKRSGTMVFSSDEKRDAAREQFVKAINEWAKSVGGRAWNLGVKERSHV